MLRLSVKIILLMCLSSHLLAEECNLTDINFPRAACKFSEPGFNVQALKFAKIDRTFSFARLLILESATFQVEEDAEIFDANEDDCEFDEEQVNNDNVGDEIAFMVSNENPRQITNLWILNCTVSQSR